jgi:predicted esterase
MTKNYQITDIETKIHGRVLTTNLEKASRKGLLVGFHGYAQNAESMMQTFAALDNTYAHCSIQALNRFYAPKHARVVASWMTSEDREHAIANNIAYVQNALETLDFSNEKLAFVGFSQGGSMAYRAAMNVNAAAVVVLGGDIPPEYTAQDLAKLPPVLICRGKSDTFYTAEKFEGDVGRLEEAGGCFEVFEFVGGHEWVEEVFVFVRGFLDRCFSS